MLRSTVMPSYTYRVLPIKLGDLTHSLPVHGEHGLSQWTKTAFSILFRRGLFRLQGVEPSYLLLPYQDDSLDSIFVTI